MTRRPLTDSLRKTTDEILINGPSMVEDSQWTDSFDDEGRGPTKDMFDGEEDWSFFIDDPVYRRGGVGWFSYLLDELV